MRHPQHDYSSASGYFITFCTARRQPLLGSIRQGSMHLSVAGKVVQQCWVQLPQHYPCVVLDAFVAMPDHVHCIIIVADPRLLAVPEILAQTSKATQITPLSEIIRGFKSLSSRQINLALRRTGQPVWQSGFMERVIRSEHELDKFRYYIETNPLRKEL